MSPLSLAAPCPGHISQFLHLATGDLFPPPVSAPRRLSLTRNIIRLFVPGQIASLLQTHPPRASSNKKYFQTRAATKLYQGAKGGLRKREN